MEQVTSTTAAILIVDDNPLMTNVLRGLLASEQYQVYVAANGEEALALLTTKDVDVIVCDIMMPRMDGFQLHHAVRKTADYSHIPFVFLSALGESNDINRGLEVGADDYIVKPFEPQALLALVRGKVQRSKSLRNLSQEKYDAYRKRVIHTLSHEFRTPLVAINTGTELLLEQKKSLSETKIANLLEAIQRGGHRLEKLVNDFMLLQQIEAGIAQRLFDTRKQVVKISEMVAQFVTNNRDDLEKQTFSINVIDHAKDIKVCIYEIHIYDVLTRLVSNAVKFCREDKQIDLFICAHADDVVVEVRDRGIGIDVARVQEAMDVFGQLDREKLEQQGGGLGLAVAARYAQIQGGRLEFEHREGGGSVVSLILPRVR